MFDAGKERRSLTDYYLWQISFIFSFTFILFDLPTCFYAFIGWLFADVFAVFVRVLSFLTVEGAMVHRTTGVPEVVDSRGMSDWAMFSC